MASVPKFRQPPVAADAGDGPPVRAVDPRNQQQPPTPPLQVARDIAALVLLVVGVALMSVGFFQLSTEVGFLGTGALLAGVGVLLGLGE